MYAYNPKLTKEEKEQLVLKYVKLKQGAVSPGGELKDLIIISYRPLVEYIARKLAFQRDDIQDLTQVGIIGLLKSLENFDPSKEIAFSTFASSNIIGEIKHYLRDKNKMLRLPRKLQERYSKIQQYIKIQLQEAGKFPGIRQIAKDLELDLEEVLESLEAGQSTQVISLDKPIYSREGSWRSDDHFSLLDSIGVDFKDEKFLYKETLKQAIKKLSERCKKIIYFRFYEGLTQKEIAIRLNLSQMHISRLLNQSIDTLKKQLQHMIE